MKNMTKARPQTAKRIPDTDKAQLGRVWVLDVIAPDGINAITVYRTFEGVEEAIVQNVKEAQACGKKLDADLEKMLHDAKHQQYCEDGVDKYLIEECAVYP